MSTNLQFVLDEFALESMAEIRSDQPAKDRMRYFDVVLEGSTETNSVLLQKLYSDVLSRSNIDYGAIPDSRGTLTRYAEYKTISTAMGQLNELFKGTDCDLLKLTNQFHDMIISCKKDYEFGYQFDIELIKVTYCNAVLTLHDLINLTILEYTKKMKKDAKIDFSMPRRKKRDSVLISGAESLLKSYTSGQWAKIIATMKKDPTATRHGVATEAGATAFTLKEAVTWVGALPTGLKVVAAVIIGTIVLLLGLRKIVYYFYYGRNKLSESIKQNKEFVETEIRIEKEEGASDNVVAKHKKLSEKLESLANWISVKSGHANKEAQKELSKSNSENYNASDFSNAGFGGSIEF